MKLRKSSEIEIAPIEWLWPGRIPLRAIVTLDGDPGTSKSTLTCDMAARVSKGSDWPDGSPCPQGTAIMCNAEDPEKEIIVPRLIAAGANLENISIILPDQGGNFTIPDHVADLEKVIQGEGVKLISFDPLEEFLSIRVSSTINQQVRHAFHSLSEMAKRTGCCILIVRHLTKDSGKSSKYRPSGSIGIIGAARSSLLLTEDPSQKGRVLMLPNKGNWSGAKDGLAYQIEPFQIPLETGEIIETSHLKWDGIVGLTANDVLASQVDVQSSTNLSNAVLFIREALAGGKIASKTVFSLGAKQGIDRTAIFTAARMLPIDRTQDGLEWFWELIDGPA